jgi:hypothetical protein
MLKNILLAGLLGGFILFSWSFVVNGIFGFNRRIALNRIPDEARVYEVLKESLPEPGRYVCNPPVRSALGFPSDEPVFSIYYSGIGHGSAGRLFLMRIVIAFVVPLIAAAMLSAASNRVLSSYGHKVAFFVALGLLFAVFRDLTSFGIDGYPLYEALLLCGYSVATWTVVGLATVWLVRPEPAAGAQSR